MTEIEIKNTPELVDFMLDKCVLADSRAKVRKRLEEICDMAIKVSEQDAEAVQFVKWVAREIFDDMWEYNKDSFAEIACRKLAKLGIVRGNGDKWELVEPQESEVEA